MCAKSISLANAKVAGSVVHVYGYGRHGEGEGPFLENIINVTVIFVVIDTVLYSNLVA